MLKTKQKQNEPELTKVGEIVSGVDHGTKDEQTIILWKVTRPITTKEHMYLSNKLRHEAEKSGQNIILVPYSVEAEVQQSVEAEVQQ